MSEVVTRKAGRPRTSTDGGRRDQKIVVYVSAGEQESLRLSAEAAGQPYSAFVRAKLLSAPVGA